MSESYERLRQQRDEMRAKRAYGLVHNTEFQVELWDAIQKWSDGNIEQKMQAVVEVNSLIEDLVRLGM